MYKVEMHNEYAVENPVEHQRGLELARVLNLKTNRDGLVVTTSGNKTYIGLYRTVKSIMNAR